MVDMEGHRIIIHRQNKSCPCLPICVSPVLWCNPFHLAQFQGCRESKTTRLLHTPNSCTHCDLIAKTPATQCHVLHRMVGISFQNLQMYPIRKKNAERSNTAQPAGSPSTECRVARLEYIYHGDAALSGNAGREIGYFYSGEKFECS